jgi:hypothetical protein
LFTFYSEFSHNAGLKVDTDVSEGHVISTINVYICRPSKMAEALKLFTCILEALGSNFVWDTDYAH